MFPAEIEDLRERARKHAIENYAEMTVEQLQVALGDIAVQESADPEADEGDYQPTEPVIDVLETARASDGDDDVESLSEDEQAHVDALEDAAAEQAVDDDLDMVEVSVLLDYVAAEGVELGGAATRDEIIAAIRSKRAAA